MVGFVIMAWVWRLKGPSVKNVHT